MSIKMQAAIRMTGPARPDQEARDSCEIRSVHPERVAMARKRLMAPGVYAELAETFSALGDATRVKIIYTLMHGELCVCDLAAALGTTEPAVSQHLRILKGLRWVRPRRSGRMVYYSLDDGHIKALLELGLTHAKDLLPRAADQHPMADASPQP